MSTPKMRIGRHASALAVLLLCAGTAAAQTQTIQPGMNEDEVKAIFGDPDGARSRGDFTFYFYINGCEELCGWPDVVFFQQGQVVDAILRATWREYGGDSSSPKGVVPRATPGGERLQIPGAAEQMPSDVERIEVRPAVTPVVPDTTEAQRDTMPPGGG